MEQMRIDLDAKKARNKRESGISQAEHHANTVHNKWSDQAFEFLKGYIAINPLFMTEDVRYASQGVVPSPPSQRAWGAVIRRAAVAGIIVKAGMKSVKNIKAHMANASVWKRKPQ